MAIALLQNNVVFEWYSRPYLMKGSSSWDHPFIHQAPDHVHAYHLSFINFVLLTLFLFNSCFITAPTWSKKLWMDFESTLILLFQHCCCITLSVSNIRQWWSLYLIQQNYLRKHIMMKSMVKQQQRINMELSAHQRRALQSGRSSFQRHWQVQLKQKKVAIL